MFLSLLTLLDAWAHTSFNRELSLAFLFIIDSLYYGKPTFTPLNFLRTNFSSVSLFYGMNAWHYYLTQAVPILCTTALPFTMHGIWSSLVSKSLHDTALKTMLKTIVWVIGIYSLAGHKEWRFIHPILPLLHIFAAKSLVDLAYNSPRLSNGSRKGTRQKKPSQSRTTSSRTFIHLRLGLPDIPNKTLFFLLLSLPVSMYIVLLYCSAPISVLSYIRAIPKEELGHSTVGYLMPCHSTPGHAYLHRKELVDGGMWALGCEPPLQYVSSHMFLWMRRFLLSLLDTDRKICQCTWIKQTSFIIPQYITSNLTFLRMWILCFPPPYSLLRFQGPLHPL